MADSRTWTREQTNRVRDFYNVYTRGFSAEEFQRLFTRDTRDAYRYFSRAVDRDGLAALPWWKRPVVFLRGLFLAITMKMSPARRVLFAVALIAAVIGLLTLLNDIHTIWIPIDPVLLRLPLLVPDWPGGTGWLIFSIFGLALLVVLEVFERLSLKNDLEIARDIQQAMLPRGLYSSGGLDAFGVTRPANTVGGDFYDILPRGDGRVMVAVGDVAGKGSPAALLMAILLAMLRTLLDEGLDAEALIDRLNVQISRHAPASRFITLQFVSIDPGTGDVVAVNAGHLPGLIYRRTGELDRLTQGGIALGMFDSSHYTAQAARLEPGDLLVLYSDGITEAESPSGTPFDEEGLIAIIRAHRDDTDLSEIGEAVIKAIEHHAQDVRFSDDLTVLLARRPANPGPPLALGMDAPGFGQRDSDIEVPPIPGTEPASFQRTPESSHSLDPGMRRGDDSPGSVPPVPGTEPVPNNQSVRPRVDGPPTPGS